MSLKWFLKLTAACALVLGGPALAAPGGDGSGGIWASHRNVKKKKPKVQEPAQPPAAEMSPATDMGAGAAAANAPVTVPSQPPGSAAQPQAAQCVATATQPCG